jgi:hypothetical protein
MIAESIIEKSSWFFVRRRKRNNFRFGDLRFQRGKMVERMVAERWFLRYGI